MAEKGKASRGRKDSVGKSGGPSSAARVERQRRAGKKGGPKKSLPKLAKKEAGAGGGSGGLH